MKKNAKTTYTPLVPAVEQAARLLICLGGSSEPTLTVTQICSKLEIHKSKGFSILQTLMQFDFITKDPATKTYSLGPGLMMLAKNVQDNLDIRKIAQPYLQLLANQTKSTVLLGIVSNDQYYIAEKYEGDDTVGITVRPNSVLDITHGAHGKAIVAFMDEDKRQKLLKRKDLCFYGKNTNFKMKFLKQELSECQKNGYAIDDGDVTPGINALSSPVFNFENEIYGAIVLVGTFSKDKFQDFGKRVFKISKEISIKYGANLQHTKGQ
jgi:DNA-binding IclR family transcriptional regulator